MAGKVFFSVTMSLDGFVAPEERLDDPDEQRWTAQWMELQPWIYPLRFFRENLKLGEGGEEGRDNDIARETFERTGASVMGKRMFDLGEHAWPEEAPFHTPVFVVTTRSATRGSGRAAPPSTSSTTASSLRSTRPARPPAIATSASRAAPTILRVPERRPVDEFTIALSPVLFGSGTRLFEGVDAAASPWSLSGAEPTQRVTHLTYAVRER